MTVMRQRSESYEVIEPGCESEPCNGIELQIESESWDKIEL